MTISSFMMIFKFSLISKKIEMDFQSQGLYQRLSTKTDTTNTMTTLMELRMKNNTPSRFLKQDDIELIVFLFENYPATQFEAELRKKFEKKCDICEVERDLETGECDCRIVECAACGEKHPKYELNLVEGVCGLRCDECDPTQSTSCYECGECLDDPATHIFCFSKEGEEDRTLCGECGQDFHKEYKSEGWTRDDDSNDDSDEEDEEELNSEDDDYEDKMEGKWKCRRCGENKASSLVGDDGDCYYYCPDCVGDDGSDEDEEKLEKLRAKLGETCTNIWKGFDERLGFGEIFVAAKNAAADDDETNWNEEGDDELCSAIDASGNALW